MASSAYYPQVPQQDPYKVDPSVNGGQPQQPQAQQAPQAPAAPAGGYNREQFRDAWMSSGGRTTQDLSNFIAQNPGFATGVQQGGSKGDIATMPDGEVLDLVIAAGRGGEGAGWTGLKGTGGQPLLNQSAQGGGSASGGAYGSSSASSSGPVRDDKWNALYDQLMGRAQQGLNVSGKDPVISSQVDSYRANQTRDNRNFLAEQAERQGPGANLNTEARMGNEAASRNTGDFQGQLMGREVAARRDEIQQALTQMGGMLSDTQRLALQKELGYMDDATRRYGIGSSADVSRYGIDTGAQTARNSLGLQAEDRASYWDAVRGGLL